MKPVRQFRRCKFIKIVILIWFISCSDTVDTQPKSEKLHIGLVFEQRSEELQKAFEKSMRPLTANKSRVDVEFFVDIINTADSFKLSRLMCNHIGRGVILMSGAVAPDSFDTIHSYLNTFQVPFVTPWFPEKVIRPSSGLTDYAVGLRPDYHRAVIDTVNYYNWKSIIYIYDSSDGLLRLQQLLQHLVPGKATFRITYAKRVSNASDAVAFLRSLEKLDRWSNKYVIVDSSTELAQEVIILHVRDVYLGRRNYHYLLTGLVMDDRWEKDVKEFGAVNITGFRLLDHSRKYVQHFLETWHMDFISAKAALMFDSVQVLVDVIFRLHRKKPELIRNAIRRFANNTRATECFNKSNVTYHDHSEKISRMLKKTDIEGLSGTLKFNEEGRRLNFSLQIVQNTFNGDMVKVAVWYDYKGFVPIRRKLAPLDVSGSYNRNKTYIVATIEEHPYFMRNRPDAPEGTSNEPYTGYCADLALLLAEKLEIKYEFRMVKDGKYGNENPKIAGGWDGMVGELVRNEVDMVIAPLIITFEREFVIDYSRPFISFDFKGTKTAKELTTASIFSFLRPLSKETWLCILCSLVVVGIVMYLVSRFSSQEWKVVSVPGSQTSDQSDAASTKSTVVNDFSFWNSMWFTLRSFMQQGSDVTPRSTSGKIVCLVWWFFILIVVCSYTANLASLLTLTHIAEPVHSYSTIAACPKDNANKKSSSYGNEIHGNEGGWFSFLLNRPKDDDSNSPCEMVVSNADYGLKDFGVGFSKGSKLRDGVNLALMALKNEGEMNKLVLKWFSKSQCDLPPTKIGGTELTLSQMAGLFYVLLFGLGLAMVVAFVEYCKHVRAKARLANVTARAALRAKSSINTTECTSPAPRRREQERDEWTGAGAFSGQYYSPGSQIGEEETEMQASFTQV